MFNELPSRASLSIMSCFARQVKHMLARTNRDFLPKEAEMLQAASMSILASGNE
jgi:hypothetical protein